MSKFGQRIKNITHECPLNTQNLAKGWVRKYQKSLKLIQNVPLLVVYYIINYLWIIECWTACTADMEISAEDNKIAIRKSNGSYEPMKSVVIGNQCIPGKYSGRSIWTFKIFSVNKYWYDLWPNFVFHIFECKQTERLCDIFTLIGNTNSTKKTVHKKQKPSDRYHVTFNAFDTWLKHHVHNDNKWWTKTRSERAQDESNIMRIVLDTNDGKIYAECKDQLPKQKLYVCAQIPEIKKDMYYKIGVSIFGSDDAIKIVNHILK